MSKPTSMRRRQQSYRKNWVSIEQRQKFVDTWAMSFREWRNEFTAGRMSAPEICARVIDRTWRDLFPRSWSNGVRSCTHANEGFLSEFLWRRYRGLPEAVPVSLQAWADGTYALDVHFREMDVAEIMALQSAGRRCVSLMLTPEHILNFDHEGRDFLSFIIHDLVHAHHMMSQGDNYRRQCDFAKLLRGFRNRLAVQGLKLEPVHQERLDYLGADMNAHLIHLLKTLKALADEIPHPGFKTELKNELCVRGLPVEDYFRLNTATENPELHLRLLESWNVKESDSSTLPRGPDAGGALASLSNSHPVN